MYFGNIPGFYYVLKQTKPTTTTTVSSLYRERSTFLRNVEGWGGGNIFRGWEVRIIALCSGISAPERTKMQSGKAQVPKVGGQAAEDQKQIKTSSC